MGWNSRCAWLMVACLLFNSLGVQTGWACPFCSAQGPTLTEEMAECSVALLAKPIPRPADFRSSMPKPPGLPQLPPSIQSAEDTRPQLPGEPENLAETVYQPTEVLKGESEIDPTQPIEAYYLGEIHPEHVFLLMAFEAPDLVWSTALPLMPKAQEYLDQLPQVPEEGAERLAFFLQYLEDEDEVVRADAYDEFAKTPYETVRALKPWMDRETILSWIENESIEQDRKRLYLTMLGICGEKADVARLETMLKTIDLDNIQLLDALIACYLTLSGEEGLPLIEKRFLHHPQVEYTEVFSAVTAIRFHVEEGNVIQKPLLVQSLWPLLQKPDLADLIIPDLARWQEWSAIDPLVQLFHEAEGDEQWVRVPIIKYLKACPLAKAKKSITDLAQIDPESVEYAELEFLPFAPQTDEGKTPKDQEPLTATTSAAPEQTPTIVTTSYTEEVAATEEATSSIVPASPASIEVTPSIRPTTKNGQSGVSLELAVKGGADSSALLWIVGALLLLGGAIAGGFWYRTKLLSARC
ncbi:Hypothetical protein PBC10988_16410 [Planctomycetales bacterium 10988]|nr:Hypothetical protein PBC10988_16410 [Planctomycetales bacterium 10988]